MPSLSNAPHLHAAGVLECSPICSGGELRVACRTGAMDATQVERPIFRAAAPIVYSVAGLTEVQRGELLPNIVRVMLAAFLEAHAR